MRMTRWFFWMGMLTLIAGIVRGFPSDPAARARSVCEPLRWLVRVATAVSSSMDDSGRIGPARSPWHDDVQRSCVRITERIFMAADDR